MQPSSSTSAPSVIPYTDNFEHVRAELARLELVIQPSLARAMAPPTAEGEPASLRGLYVSGAEVEQLLQAPDTANGELHTQLHAHVLAASEELSARRAAALDLGVPLRLPTLGRLFQLVEWEERLLVLCLAPIVDQRFEKFFAYLNDDLNRKGPTLHLAAELVFEPQVDTLARYATLTSSTRLFRAGLVRVLDEDRAASRMSCLLRLDERIASYLLGGDALPGEVGAFSRLALPSPISPDREPLARLTAAVRHHLASDTRPAAEERRLLVRLEGREGSGRRALAEAVCADLDIPLVVVDLPQLCALSDSFDTAIRLATREALLQPAALYMHGVDALTSAPSSVTNDERQPDHGAPNADRLAALLRAIEDFSWLTFLASERPFRPTGRWREHAWLQVALPTPDDVSSVEIWQRVLSAYSVDVAPTDLDRLAAQFRFTEGQIRATVQSAADATLLETTRAQQLESADLARASRAQSVARVGSLAQRIDSRNSWPDIVLPADTLSQLRELVTQVRYRRTVLGTWGFGQKLARGKGLAALFSGPSGTGKTMAAEIVAGDLELDLYRVDLASVVSKYIGETEKNLARLFDEAEQASAVLFFDEADALFGKRSEVKDAHDRYANIEISYLLQRIETFEGLVMLATNLKKNMDGAFLRRLQFSIDFPFPDARLRRSIWEGLFPKQAPRSPDIDFEFLAQQLPLAGGNIRNVVVYAAFLAASSNEPIGMTHLMRAGRREYDKIGRLGAEADFGAYWALVSEAT